MVKSNMGRANAKADSSHPSQNSLGRKPMISIISLIFTCGELHEETDNAANDEGDKLDLLFRNHVQDK